MLLSFVCFGHSSQRQRWWAWLIHVQAKPMTFYGHSVVRFHASLTDLWSCCCTVLVGLTICMILRFRLGHVPPVQLYRLWRDTDISVSVSGARQREVIKCCSLTLNQTKQMCFQPCPRTSKVTCQSQFSRRLVPEPWTGDVERHVAELWSWFVTAVDDDCRNEVLIDKTVQDRTGSYVCLHVRHSNSLIVELSVLFAFNVLK